MTDILSSLQQLKRGLEGRDRELVNDAGSKLIAAKARLGLQWHAITKALATNGEWTLALAAMDRFTTDTRDAAGGYAKANLLYEAGRLDEALAELRAFDAAGDYPRETAHRVSVLNLHASIALLVGETDEARAKASEALELDPRSGQAWFTLSELADFRAGDAALREPLEQAYAAGASLRREAAKLAHAAGRMRHQLGDHEGAFAAFASGAELFSSDQGSPARAQPTLAERSIDFPQALIDRIQQQVTVPHDRVIFVTGLPRSGTTLVEQILVSHPDVAHGEELNLFRILVREIGGIDAPSVTRWLDSGGDPNRLVALYLHLAQERFGPDGRFVDKTIEAGNYMGLLLALFPKAPVFWLLRDPLDNGWSAFRTMFVRGAPWSWDLRHIGDRLAQEQRMVDHWANAAADRISFIDYEALVRDPESHIRDIASAAGLAMDDRMLTPHTNDRAVTTASVSQVREPINLKGLGVAKPYRSWLQPVVDSFDAHVAAGRSAPAGASDS